MKSPVWLIATGTHLSGSITELDPVAWLDVFSADPTYFRGRCADIILLPPGRSIGRLGVVHPNVLRNFDLSLCVSAFEIDIESFL